MSMSAVIRARERPAAERRKTINRTNRTKVLVVKAVRIDVRSLEHGTAIEGGYLTIGIEKARE